MSSYIKIFRYHNKTDVNLRIWNLAVKCSSSTDKANLNSKFH